MEEEELNEIILHIVQTCGQNRHTYKAEALKKCPTERLMRLSNAWKLWNNFTKGGHILKKTNKGQMLSMY